MKRRGKIIATISTLFLSLAMLVFGVYSAISVSFTIGGTVAYELKDVLVDVNTNFYYSTNNTVLEGDAIITKATAVADETLPADLSSVEGFTTKSVSTYKNGQVVELTEEEKTISGLQVNFGRYDAESENKKSYSYYLVMELTNYGENPVAVSIVDNTTAENVQKLSTTAINFVNNNVNITKNATKKVVVAFNLTDLTQSIDSTDFNFVVTIAESIYIPTMKITNTYTKPDGTLETINKEMAANVSFDNMSNKVDSFFNDINFTETYGFLLNLTIEDIPDEYTSLYIVKVDVASNNVEEYSETYGVYSHMDNFEQAVRDTYGSQETFTGVIDLTKKDESNKLEICLIVMEFYTNDTEVSCDLLLTTKAEPIAYIFNEEERTCQVVGVEGYFEENDNVNVQIPDKVTRLEDNKVYRVTSIAPDAFKNCSIVSLSLPNSITDVGIDCFNNADMENITVADGGKYTTKVNGVNTNCIIEKGENDTYTLLVPSTNYILAEGITHIGPSAFTLLKLTSVVLPDSVVSIGNSAFERCTSLASVDLGNVQSIGNSAFERCTSLASVDLGNVQSIGNSAFRYCKNITEITIPDSVVSIGSFAFDDCTSLASVDLGNVQSIGGSAFSGCSKITEIIIPDSVVSIGSFAFDGCSSLASVDLGNVQSIGGSAFSRCSKITEIIIPDSVTSIEYSTFSGCSSLASVDLGNVQSIGGYAFSNCKNITEITIPDSVVSIGGYAFEKWTSNQEIYFEGTSMPEDLDTNWKTNCSAKIYLENVLQN